MNTRKIIAYISVIILPACVIGPKSRLGNYELSSASCKDCRSSELRGEVRDITTKESLPFSTVVVHDPVKQVRVSAGAADIDGNFVIKPIPHGTYTITAYYTGYHSVSIQNARLDSARVSLKIEMQADETPPPRMDNDPYQKGNPNERTLDREEIKRMPK